jgi:hypothetical protein
MMVPRRGTGKALTTTLVGIDARQACPADGETAEDPAEQTDITAPIATACRSGSSLRVISRKSAIKPSDDRVDLRCGVALPRFSEGNRPWFGQEVVSKVFAWKTHDRIPKKSGTVARICSPAASPAPWGICRSRRRAAQVNADQ